MLHSGDPHQLTPGSNPPTAENRLLAHNKAIKAKPHTQKIGYLQTEHWLYLNFPDVSDRLLDNPQH